MVSAGGGQRCSCESLLCRTDYYALVSLSLSLLIGRLTDFTCRLVLPLVLSQVPHSTRMLHGPCPLHQCTLAHCRFWSTVLDDCLLFCRRLFVCHSSVPSILWLWGLLLLSLKGLYSPLPSPHCPAPWVHLAKSAPEYQYKCLRTMVVLSWSSKIFCMAIESSNWSYLSPAPWPVAILLTFWSLS